MNLWKDIETGSRPPEEIFVVAELPKGSRNKYEYSKERMQLILIGCLILRCITQERMALFRGSTMTATIRSMPNIATLATCKVTSSKRSHSF